MGSTSRSHLAFLLSLGALPVACGDGGNSGDGTDTDAGTAGDTDGMTGMMTSPMATTASMTTTAGMTTTTTTTTTDPTVDPDDTTAAPDDTTTDGGETTGTSTGDPPASSCEALFEHYAKCLPRYAPYIERSIEMCPEYMQYFNDISPECGEAVDEAFACLAETSCDELLNTPKGEPGPCDQEIATVEEICGFDDTDTDTGEPGDGGDGGEPPP